MLRLTRDAPSLELIPAAADYEATIHAGWPFILKDIWPDAFMFSANSYLFKEEIGYWGYRLLRR